jgi:uncharacterized phage protein gp47/JayE
MTLSCTINSAGITAPTYAQILANLKAAYLGIFGSDAYLGNDSQDGQLLGIFAAAINDSNAATIQTYNNFSPAFALGNGLSSAVKINGIRRLVASNSTAPMLITGQAGTIINNGMVSDAASHNWALPATVTIPTGGSITVLGTSATLGSVAAPSGSINQIATPTLGWQTASNTTDATLGAPVETDYALRLRQSISVAYPALAVNQAVAAAVANVPGVLKSELYENPLSTTDANGIPGHSICVVASGGDPVAVAGAIASRKTPGTGTYGTTTEVVMAGNHPQTVSFYQASNQVLTATITLHALSGYTSLLGDNAKQALVNHIASFDIGHPVYLTSAQAACIGANYHLVNIAFGLNGGGQSVADVTIPFNGLASLALADIAITLV